MSKPNYKQLLIEKELLGELPAEAKASLPTDGEEQLANLRADNEEILGKYPAARVAKEISRRLAKEKEAEETAPQRRWAMILLPAAAVPLVLAAVLWGPRGPLGSGRTTPVGDDSTMIGDDSDVQLKGQAADLRIYRRRDGAPPERLQDGNIVHPGEVIQLAYLPAGRGFGVIVSLDGSGNVELHHPAAADAPPVLARGGEQPLGSGYKLDAAPHFERFFFITAKRRESLQVAQVVQAVRSLSTQPGADRAPLSLHGQVEIHSLTLRKEGP